MNLHYFSALCALILVLALLLRALVEWLNDPNRQNRSQGAATLEYKRRMQGAAELLAAGTITLEQYVLRVADAHRWYRNCGHNQHVL
jgi:hypothetical protein